MAILTVVLITFIDMPKSCMTKNGNHNMATGRPVVWLWSALRVFSTVTECV